jgi:hypothetical protein
VSAAPEARPPIKKKPCSLPPEISRTMSLKRAAFRISARRPCGSWSAANATGSDARQPASASESRAARSGSRTPRSWISWKPSGMAW